MHWRIHTRLNTMLLIARMAVATYSGLMKALVIVMRRRNRQMEIFVKVKVAKVCTPYFSIA